MPEVKVLCDVFEDFLEVGYNLGVTVWDKGGYYNATSSKEVHAQLKTHELHCRAVAMQLDSSEKGKHQNWFSYLNNHFAVIACVHNTLKFTVDLRM